MWINKFKKHKVIKEKLLSLIDRTPESNIDKINKTDYFSKRNLEEGYLKLFYPHLINHLKNLLPTFKSLKCEVHGVWFQQYIKNNIHDWHTHGHSNYAGIYYLELPNKSLITEFLDETKPNITEGDILIFYASKYHRSPLNKTNKRKTVISFNCSFSEWNGEY